MRRPSPYVGRREELEIKMTPMIDVVFLLLVFFVWTASFQIVEQVLPSALSEVSGSLPADPAEPPPVEEDFDRVVVRVMWSEGEPIWRINQIRVGSLPQVRSRLEAIARIKVNVPLILHPDGDVPLGAVIDLYDLTRLVGFQEIQFAASEDV
jgi:biopolymer transport protein ExbD